MMKPDFLGVYSCSWLSFTTLKSKMQFFKKVQAKKKKNDAASIP